MKPFSDLDLILHDGARFQSTSPYKRVQDVTISTHQVADLVLTSGRLLAYDLLMSPDSRYSFQKTLAPGTYPVVLSVADIQPAGDARIACAELRITNAKTVRWELAALNTPDNNPDFNYYGVDSGTGSFMDVDVADALSTLFWEPGDTDTFEEFCNRVTDELDKHPLTARGRPEWADMIVNEQTGANVIVFSSGWGDGGYRSFWGYDEFGNVTSLVTDFALFGDND